MITINDLLHSRGKGSTSDNWIDVRKVNDHQSWLRQYEDICIQHKIANKWILMIDPEDQTIEQLSKARHIDTSKILKVNSYQGKLNVENLSKALSKGNCSAIVLSNQQLKEEELRVLKSCAAQGQTNCIVLNKTQPTVH